MFLYNKGDILNYVQFDKSIYIYVQLLSKQQRNTFIIEP